MVRWKRVVSLSAAFSAVAILAFAGPGGGGREGRAGGGKRGGAGGSRANQSVTMVARFIAKDVGLAADKTEKFVQAYVAEREAAMKRLAETAKEQGQKVKGEAKSIREESQKRMDAVLNEHLTAEQVKKVKEYGLEGLERSVRALIQSKVEEAKMDLALPVLAKFHKATEELMTKRQSKEITRQDAAAKEKELKTATAKELTPIIGEDAATRWEGAKTGAGGKQGAGGGKRAKGAQGTESTATPVTPVAP